MLYFITWKSVQAMLSRCDVRDRQFKSFARESMNYLPHKKNGLLIQKERALSLSVRWRDLKPGSPVCSSMASDHNSEIKCPCVRPLVHHGMRGGGFQGVVVFRIHKHS